MSSYTEGQNAQPYCRIILSLLGQNCFLHHHKTVVRNFLCLFKGYFSFSSINTLWKSTIKRFKKNKNKKQNKQNQNKRSLCYSSVPRGTIFGEGGKPTKDLEFFETLLKNFKRWVGHYLIHETGCATIVFETFI